jgi:hypothetical protein
MTSLSWTRVREIDQAKEEVRNLFESMKDLRANCPSPRERHKNQTTLPTIRQVTYFVETALMVPPNINSSASTGQHLISGGDRMIKFRAGLGFEKDRHFHHFYASLSLLSLPIAVFLNLAANIRALALEGDIL